MPTNDYLTRILEAADSHSAFVSPVIPQVDIPEPENATSIFTYNYYTPGEMTPGSSATNIQDPTDPASTIDQTYVASRTYSIVDGAMDPETESHIRKSSGYYSNQTARFPMYNKVSWDKVQLDNPPIDQALVDDIASQLADIYHLAEHEESFGSGMYSGIITPTVNVYEKSSTAIALMADNLTSTQLSEFLSSASFSVRGNPSSLSDRVGIYEKVQDVYAALNNSLFGDGVTFGSYSGGAEVGGIGSETFGTSVAEMTATLVSVFSNYQVSDYDIDGYGSGGVDITSEEHAGYAFNAQNNVTWSASIYNPVYADVIRKASQIGTNWYSDDYNASQSAAGIISRGAATGQTGELTSGMFPVINPVTIVFPEDTTAATAETADDQVSASVVGYIIEKYSADYDAVRQRNGGGDDVPTFLISPYADGTELTDSDLTYGVAYNYAVRTATLIQVPIINRSPLGPDSDQAGYAYVLVLSKPNYTNSAHAVDTTPPPHPSNLDFIYNYSDNTLFIYWEMPTNPQEDIVTFQVFRRKSLQEPYELIAQYDWDESEIPYDQTEVSISSRLSSYQAGIPTVSCIDYEFTKDSTYHYAICSVDARRLSSGYSSQFEVSFNRFKNKINVKKVSFPGAPKPYPNLYIASDTFEDSIKTSEYDTFFVFFNPDFYYLSDTGSDLNFISTGDKPTYHMNVLNTDMQDMETINIKIKDTGGAFAALKP